MDIFIDKSSQNFISILTKNLARIILISISVALLVFSFTTLFIEKQYSSTSKIYLEVSKDNNTSLNLNQLNYAQKAIKSYLQILQSNNFYEQLIKKYDIAIDPETLADMTTYSVISDTEVFNITVKSSSPEESQQLTNYISDFASEYIKSYSTSDNLKVVDYATLPVKPVSPNVFLNVTVSFILAVIISSLVYIIINTMSFKVKSSEDLEQRYNLSVLAVIPRYTTLKEKTK